MDHAFMQMLGQRRSADFDADGAATGVPEATHRVRYFGTGPELILPAKQIATVRDGTWMWLDPEAEEFGEEFGIPEFTSAQPDSLLVERAARTLHNNAPLVRAPRADHSTDILILLGELPVPEAQQSIRAAIPMLTPDQDVRRALVGFAAMRGLPISITEWDAEIAGVKMVLRDGLLIDVVSEISIDDIRADAIFLSAENQLRAHSLFPECQGELKPDGNSAILRAANDTTLMVQAIPIAVMTESEWTWAWADPISGNNPASQRLRDFGARHGIPALVQPRLPITTAWQLNLPEVCKPILGSWVHIVVPYGPNKWAMILVSAPPLELPPPTKASIEGVLRTKIDPVLDRTRCATAYASARGLHHTTNDFKVIFHTPDADVEWSRY